MPQQQRFAVLKSNGFNLAVTQFTQSLGSELLTNGDFAAWTGDNPDSWTVTGESGADPEVTQRAANAGHAGAGTGACNLFSSATGSQPRVSQTVMTTGLIYQLQWNITNFVSGSMTQSNLFASASTFNTTGVKAVTGRAAATSISLLNISVPADITIDDATLKLYTLNTQQVVPISNTTDFKFSLNGSPNAGEEVHLLYRIVGGAGAELLNCWDVYLRRNAANNAWDIRTDRITAGTRTNVAGLSATGIGTPDTLRIVTSGDNHSVFTGVASVFTQRGTTQSSAVNNTGTGLNTLYVPGTTPVSLLVAA